MRTGNCRLQDYVQVPRKPAFATPGLVQKVNEDARDAKFETKLKSAIAGLSFKPSPLPQVSEKLFHPKELAKLIKPMERPLEAKPSVLTKNCRIPFYYGSSARFTSSNKLYVDFEHMFRTVVLPHNLASSAYMQWLKSDGPCGPRSFKCLLDSPPREHTTSTPFNVCIHPECQKKSGKPCGVCHSLQCTSEKVCKRLMEQREEAFQSSLAGYTKEEKIATCTEFWDYIFAGEEKLSKELRSTTQHDMLLRIWKARPKALFFLKHVFNPTATPEGVIKIE